MTIILIVLASTLISAFLLGSFALGYYFGQRKQAEPKLHIDKLNQDAVKSATDFIYYRG